jgi:hypothetical protein
MGEPKTVLTGASVDNYLATVPDVRRADATELCALMAKATGAEPAMWGSAIVGFGTYHYVYSSGREGDWPPVGFSPRKANLTVYLADGTDKQAALLAKLGPHTTGKGCLYIKRLSDVDTKVLQQLVKNTYNAMDGKILHP